MLMTTVVAMLVAIQSSRQMIEPCFTRAVTNRAFGPQVEPRQVVRFNRPGN
jgi:hypothetical protein